MMGLHWYFAFLSWTLESFFCGNRGDDELARNDLHQAVPFKAENVMQVRCKLWTRCGCTATADGSREWCAYLAVLCLDN